nr:hypothetical protein [uncultured Cohaesibacter sp.]
MIVWQCLKAQRAVSLTWALSGDDGEAVIVAGLWMRSDGIAEAWFLARPEAAKYLRRIVRHIRLTLARSPYAEIEVRITTRAGAHIARLSGFTLAEITSGMEIWRYGRIVGRRRKQGRGSFAEEDRRAEPKEATSRSCEISGRNRSGHSQVKGRWASGWRQQASDLYRLIQWPIDIGVRWFYGQKKQQSDKAS